MKGLLSFKVDIKRAQTKDMGDRAVVVGEFPLSSKVEEEVSNIQLRSFSDFMTHTALSCSGRLMVLTPRRQWARSSSHSSLSDLSIPSIVEEDTKSRSIVSLPASVLIVCMIMAPLYGGGPDSIPSTTFGTSHHQHVSGSYDHKSTTYRGKLAVLRKSFPAKPASYSTLRPSFG